MPALLVYGYEFYDEGVGKANLEAKQALQVELSARLSAFGKQVEEVRKIKEEKQRLSSRIDTIREISKERLVNAKAMDALHAIVPNQSWLESLSIEGRQIKIKGMATEDIIISQFLRNLDESIYFSEVKLISSIEQASGQGVIKSFEIECQLGR